MKITSLSNVALLISWVLLSQARGTELSPPFVSTTPQSPTTIKIHVSSALGNPIPEVKVELNALFTPELLHESGGRIEEMLKNESPESLKKIVFNSWILKSETGTQFQKVVRPGIYTIHVSAAGWKDELIKEIDIEPGETKELKIMMKKGYVISGAVVDENDNPLSEVEIGCFPGDRSPGSIVHRVQSDTGGGFIFSSLEKGVYRLYASKPGYIKDSIEGVKTGEDGIKLVLRKGLCIKGILEGDIQSLGPSIKLELKGTGRRILSRTVPLTNQKECMIDALKTGSYSLRVKDGYHLSDWGTGVRATSPEKAIPVTLIVYKGSGLSGKVINATDGSIIPNARLRLSAKHFKEVRHTSTDYEGKYLFQGLPPGEYQLDLQTENKSYSEYGIEENFTLSPGQILKGKDIYIDPGRRVTFTGRVIDGNGEPVAGVEINLLLQRPGKKSFQMGLKSSTFSREKGIFILFALCPDKGEVKLLGEKEGFAQVQSKPIRLTPGQNTISDIVLRLTSGHFLRVSVEDIDGNPISSARVKMEDHMTNLKLSRVRFMNRSTDDVGTCLFENLLPGYYYIKVSKQGYSAGKQKVQLQEGESEKNIRIVLKKGRMLKIHAVDSQGRVVENAKISIRRGRYASRPQYLDTDSHGQCLFRDLPQETLLLSIEAEGHSSIRNKPILKDQKDVTVCLEDAGSIIGRLRDHNGNTIPEVRINARFQETESVENEFIDHSQNRKVELEAGYYRVKNLYPGRYDLIIIGPGMAAMTIKNVDVQAGEERDIGEIGLEPEGLISGRVIDDREGSPIRRASIRVEGKDKSSYSSHDLTDTDGHFSLKNLSPGNYTITAKKKNYRLLTIPDTPISPVEKKLIPDIKLTELTQEEKDEREQEQKARQNARGYIPSIGVRMGNVENHEGYSSIPIGEVIPGSAADKGGLKPGDAIIKVNGKSLFEAPQAFIRGLKSRPGTKIELTIKRSESGKEDIVGITIDDWDYEETTK